MLLEALSMLLGGFADALTPLNLAMAAIGALVGTLVGVLPGLGPTSAIAILLPLTTVLGPVQGIIMLAGIYYGAMYGGSTTAILLNIPGEAASVPTCLDGYPLARQGRGGPALGIAAIGSFLAGTLGVFGLVFSAPWLADQALKFGPPEYFALMVLAITVIVNLAGNSMTKGLIMGITGLVLSMIGLGPVGGQMRFDFGIDELSAGLDMVSVIIGLFAITEVLKGMEEKQTSISADQIGSVYPTKADLIQRLPAMFRGGLIGFFLGLLPGCAPAVTTFLAYDVEKKVSKHPEKFGTGVMEGVASPESANNATTSAGFIPLFAFGLPSSPALAVLLAGLMIYGLQPGPMLFEQNGSFVWTIIASMFIGNIMLLMLNLPLIGLWTKITQIPYGVIAPIIFVLSIIGAYTVRNSMFDILVALIFGVLGYIFHKYHWPVVPLVLAFILGPMLERSFVQSLSMSAGDFSVFFVRPISLTLLIVSVVLVYVSVILMKRTKEQAKAAVGDEVDIAE